MCNRDYNTRVTALTNILEAEAIMKKKKLKQKLSKTEKKLAKVKAELKDLRANEERSG